MPPGAASARTRRPRELTGRGLPEVDVRDLQGISAGERGTFGRVHRAEKLAQFDSLARCLSG